MVHIRIEDIEEYGNDAEEIYSVTGIRTHQKEGMRLIRKNGKTVKRFYKTNK